MACNCKKSIKIEEKYGVKEEESLIVKINRWIFKLIVFVITLMLAIVATPIMILIVIYKLFFAKHKEIILPKKLQKFLK